MKWIKTQNYTHWAWARLKNWLKIGGKEVEKETQTKSRKIETILWILVWPHKQRAWTTIKGRRLTNLWSDRKIKIISTIIAIAVHSTFVQFKLSCILAPTAKSRWFTFFFFFFIQNPAWEMMCTTGNYNRVIAVQVHGDFRIEMNEFAHKLKSAI